MGSGEGGRGFLPLAPFPRNNRSSNNTARAPRRRAPGMNSWPSWRSPLRGIKSSPAWQVRESVLTPQKVSQAPARSRVPPLAARISAVVKVARIRWKCPCLLYNRKIDLALFSSPLLGEGRVGVKSNIFHLPLPPTPSHPGRGSYKAQYW
jgi:hypothetical protein